ncbi:superoxide dismutase [Cu-Zn]-like isoform X2 [Carcharodon carcharias]|uniref:superoxide dismutase [Cu-Zn]-like isoform X2 n=1 Tax=Carcharodon carcharias TaxID=13397 RepID=UPI001B7F5FB0|nr:superoxide dismutase [Cu-Zn]-like isoform X2 [Carcharodon carcharias]
MANAICVLNGHFSVFGVVLFKMDITGCVIVKGEFTGLPPGKHGLHIHSFGDLTNGWISAGPHYNPDNEIHGAPEENKRHAGDLGNVEVDEDGLAKLDMKIHQNEDDLGKGDNEESLTTGNTGEGLAWGVIGICQSDILDETLEEKSN